MLPAAGGAVWKAASGTGDAPDDKKPKTNVEDDIKDIMDDDEFKEST